MKIGNNEVEVRAAISVLEDFIASGKYTPEEVTAMEKELGRLRDALKALQDAGKTGFAWTRSSPEARKALQDAGYKRGEKLVVKRDRKASS